jgi:hypothetical protein
VDCEKQLPTFRRHEILDLVSGPSFDRIVRLAIHPFHSSKVFVDVADADGQWFKSAAGLDIVEMSTGENRPEVLVCIQSIQGRRVPVLQDLFVGEPWVDNPDLTDRGPRFYAGPLSPNQETNSCEHRAWCA